MKLICRKCRTVNIGKAIRKCKKCGNHTFTSEEMERVKKALAKINITFN